jgi:hypothetical protein
MAEFAEASDNFGALAYEFMIRVNDQSKTISFLPTHPT